jgi:hypothetical protein
MSKAFRKLAKAELASTVSNYTNKFTEIPKWQWPSMFQVGDHIPVSVFMSRKFLAQVYSAKNGFLRISVTKCEFGKGRVFADGISWDELQEIKRGVGFGDRFAIEVYPEDLQIVNDANMRHLWIFPEGQRLDCAWLKSNA